jgi:hypothetical protein
MRAQRVAGRGPAGNEEDLGCTFERIAEARSVRESSTAYADAALAERFRLFGIADADTNLCGGDLLNETLDDGSAKLAVGSGDDNHGDL